MDTELSKKTIMQLEKNINNYSNISLRLALMGVLKREMDSFSTYLKGQLVGVNKSSYYLMEEA